MPDISQILIAICLCGVMFSIVGLIPQLFTLYRERYQTSLSQTSRELNRFFFDIKPSKMVLIIAVVGVVGGLLTRSWVLAVAIAGGGLFAPKIALSIWKDIRSAQVEAQLQDALVILSNSLKSGLDIASGLERVATSMKPPISEEFGLVVNAYRLGTPLETALMDLTDRVNSRTLETVVYALSIQRETGGNIIKIFDQLIGTIRDESKLQNKIKAMTSQGRMQIIFLACFPWALAAFFFFASPDIMRPALNSTWGQIVLVLLILWEIVGIFVTRKMVTVDI